MAFAVIGALAAAASAASGIYGTVASGNAQGAARQQAAQQNYENAQRTQQNAENQQQYERALNSEMMRRSVAGTRDSQGSSTQYDPATNEWRTVLGPGPQNVQNASNAASISRNTTDLATSQGANRDAVMRSLMAGREVGPALAAVRNFKPMDTDTLAGVLQQRSTQANRAAQDPIIADTLRQFARTGTAAGPVLTQMQRDNSDTLRKTIMDDTISAMTQGESINNSKRAGLMNNYSSLSAAANPSLQFSPISTQNPSDELAKITAERSKTATQAPGTAAFNAAYGTQGVNQASSGVTSALKDLLANFQPSTSANTIGALGGQFKGAADAAKGLWNAFTSGDNNNGDLSGAIRSRIQDYQRIPDDAYNA